MSEESADAIRDCFDEKNIGSFNNPKWKRGQFLEAADRIGDAAHEIACALGKDVEEGDEIAYTLKRIADAIERIADKIAPAQSALPPVTWKPG